MKTAFKKALNLYQYLSILGSILYWIYSIYADSSLTNQYWSSSWLEYVGIYIRYFLAFFFVLSVYYWVIVSLLILMYYKWIKRGEADSHDTGGMD